MFHSQASISFFLNYKRNQCPAVLLLQIYKKKRHRLKGGSAGRGCISATNSQRKQLKSSYIMRQPHTDLIWQSYTLFLRWDHLASEQEYRVPWTFVMFTERINEKYRKAQLNKHWWLKGHPWLRTEIKEKERKKQQQQQKSKISSWLFIWQKRHVTCPNLCVTEKILSSTSGLRGLCWSRRVARSLHTEKRWSLSARAPASTQP